MSKTMSVAAIKQGTVIDHVNCGVAFSILHLLKVLHKKHKVTVGMNLPSKRMKFKDLIKIEDHIVTKLEANEITVFAPYATINIIKNFEVNEKIITELPQHIQNMFVCPNPLCITQSDPIESCFLIEEQRDSINLTCKFCEKTFDRNQVKVKL